LKSPASIYFRSSSTSKDASFRLVVGGEIDVKESERLIQKLQLDKEILAEKFPWEEKQQ